MDDLTEGGRGGLFSGGRVRTRGAGEGSAMGGTCRMSCDDVVVVMVGGRPMTGDGGWRARPWWWGQVGRPQDGVDGGDGRYGKMLRGGVGRGGGCAMCGGAGHVGRGR